MLCNLLGIDHHPQYPELCCCLGQQLTLQPNHDIYHFLLHFWNQQIHAWEIVILLSSTFNDNMQYGLNVKCQSSTKNCEQHHKMLHQKSISSSALIQLLLFALRKTSRAKYAYRICIGMHSHQMKRNGCAASGSKGQQQHNLYNLYKERSNKKARYCKSGHQLFLFAERVANQYHF